MYGVLLFRTKVLCTKWNSSCLKHHLLPLAKGSLGLTSTSCRYIYTRREEMRKFSSNVTFTMVQEKYQRLVEVYVGLCCCRIIFFGPLAPVITNLEQKRDPTHWNQLLMRQQTFWMPNDKAYRISKDRTIVVKTAASYWLIASCHFLKNKFSEMEGKGKPIKCFVLLDSCSLIYLEPRLIILVPKTEASIRSSGSKCVMCLRCQESKLFSTEWRHL